MHGTRGDPKRHHPVVDLDYWRSELAAVPDERPHQSWIDTPRRLVRMEARRAAAFAKLPKPPDGVAVDLFLWGYGYAPAEKPYLTRVGGVPWRDARKPWPTSTDGRPLTFLAQLCFLDSKDLFDGELPGDVLLIFADYSDDYVVLEPDSVAIEWSSIRLDRPTQWEHVPKKSQLHFELRGAIHRTVQYPDHDHLFDERSVYDAVWHGTIIGREAFMPQGSSTEGLIATLGSILPSDAIWPLLNVPALPVCVFPKGHSAPIELWRLHIGDAGVIAVKRNPVGQFTTKIEF